ncbi:MAG TPA: ModD protein [Nitrososphaeria archaeon]|nr:ModD protein [Nitrososphaeria archaeon]
MLEYWISEDLGAEDLTTKALDIKGMGEAVIFAREAGIVACTEEASEIYRILGVKEIEYKFTGESIERSSTILKARGDLKALHAAWRLAQQVIAIFSGMATKSKRLVEKAHEVDPKVVLVSTRKTYPGLRVLAFKAIRAGGMIPHRSGLSDSILIFKNHIRCLGGFEKLVGIIPELKKRYPFRKIGVEVDDLEQAIILVKAGVDLIQFDKLPPKDLSEAVVKLKEMKNELVIAAAGGIDEHNIEDYVRAGVDLIVTSAPYYARPLDIGTKISPI